MIWVPFGESQVKRVLLTQVKAPAIAECYQENCSGNRISPGRFPRVSSLPLQFPLDRPAGPFKLNRRLPQFLQIRQFERVAIGAKNDASSGFGQCFCLTKSSISPTLTPSTMIADLEAESRTNSPKYCGVLWLIALITSLWLRENELKSSKRMRQSGYSSRGSAVRM